MHQYDSFALCETQHLNKRDNNYYNYNYNNTTKIQQMRRHALYVWDGSNLIYYLELARFVREARWNYFITKYLKTSVTACLTPLSPRSACLLLENLKNLYWTWAIFYMQHNSPDFSTCKTSAAPDKLTPREENFLVLLKLCLVSETTIKISKVLYKQRADFITGRNSNCMNKKFPTNNWKPCCELSPDDFFLGVLSRSIPFLV